jgi:hypothetical protein
MFRATTTPTKGQFLALHAAVQLLLLSAAVAPLQLLAAAVVLLR